MSLLPRSIPAPSLAVLTSALSVYGLELGPLKPGARVTHTVTFRDVTWELTYLGLMGWGLRGPQVEHGLGVSAEGAAEHIAAYGSRDLTYRGVAVPQHVADTWQTHIAETWRDGVDAALTHVALVKGTA